MTNQISKINNNNNDNNNIVYPNDKFDESKLVFLTRLLLEELKHNIIKYFKIVRIENTNKLWFLFDLFENPSNNNIFFD